MAIQLRQALRSLLLPMRAKQELNCALELRRVLRDLEIQPSDALTWTTLERERWKASGRASDAFSSCVRKLVFKGDDHFGQVVSDAYFRLHQKLCEEHLLSHDQAIAFLSHAFLICELAQTERCSAAQIARLIGQRDRRVNFSRPSVAAALSDFECEPEISRFQVEQLFHRDGSEELPKFADSDLRVSAEIVGRQAQDLGFIGEMSLLLQKLTPPAALDSYAPYLQILHFQCCIAEHFDHLVTDLYEFSPRGRAVDWLLEQYPVLLSGAGNPFLNNAKSVERLTEHWVRSKKTAEQRLGANALFEILSGMDEMGFAARRELARWIRMWLHRVLRIAGPAHTALPAALTKRNIRNLRAAIALRNTKSFGILEQRVVDAVASASHDPLQWRSRGLGDSVNATNVSRSKLGDCDFQDSINKRIEAYESHGGELSNVYVEDHIRTLTKSVEKRLDELLGISDADKWSISIVFVAHKISANLPRTEVISGLTMELSAVSFEDFLKSVDEQALRIAVNARVLPTLAGVGTPDEVRKSLLAYIAE